MLDLEGYRKFDAALRKIAADAGEWLDDENRTEVDFAMVNRISGEAQGLTMAEMMQG